MVAGVRSVMVVVVDAGAPLVVLLLAAAMMMVLKSEGIIGYGLGARWLLVRGSPVIVCEATGRKEIVRRDDVLKESMVSSLNGLLYSR